MENEEAPKSKPHTLHISTTPTGLAVFVCTILLTAIAWYSAGFWLAAGVFSNTVLASFSSSHAAWESAKRVFGASVEDLIQQYEKLQKYALELAIHNKELSTKLGVQEGHDKAIPKRPKWLRAPTGLE